MTNALLPRNFRLTRCGDLVRLGRDNDGGYLVSASDIEHTDILFGLGINDDWSFERDFCTANPCPVFAYDASLSARGLFKNTARAFLTPNKPRRLLASLKSSLDYFRFFSGNRRHVKKFVGLDIGGPHIGFRDIVEKIGSGRAFLKIDIEGSEYRILDEIVDISSSITGIAIEFHDCDIHLETIKKFIAEVDLKLVHAHANNFSLVCQTGVPLVLELTFSRHGKFVEGPVDLPHLLDMPNWRKRDEIALRIAA